MQKKTILIVDDDYIIRKHLELLFQKNGFQTISCEKGKDALIVISQEYDSIQLVLLDVTMEGMDGYETARQLEMNSDTKDIPIVFITGNMDDEDKKKGFEAGCVDYIVKPFNNDEVLLRAGLHIELFERRKEALHYGKVMEEKVIERTQELYRTRKALIISLSALAESRDPETGAHLLRTQEYTKLLALTLRSMPVFKEDIDDTFIDLIYDCSPLHDIGKVGIKDSILLKPGKLTAEEFAIMKTHTTIGHDSLQSTFGLLGETSFLRFAADIAVSHHEWFNGNGYPYGLSGDAIPLAGRIMALADVYDALRSFRVYKEPWPHKKTLETIIAGSGTQFDPEVIKAFRKIEKEFDKIHNRYSDD